MGKNKFDRKKAVKFILVPGPIKDGKPTVLYKPAENVKTRVPKKQRKNLISKISDYDEIIINGKVVDDNEIPSFVLDQIRGRNDLLFNQLHKNEGEEEQYEQGDLYEIEDAKQDEQYEEYDDIDDEELQNQHRGKAKQIKEEQNEDDWQDDEQWQQGDDQEDWQDDENQDDDYEQIEEVKTKPIKFINKQTDFPTIQPLQDFQIDGKLYKMTKTQIKMLDSVIPQNYESMNFGGLKFKKYNEDGLLLSQKQKYEKYLVDQTQVGIIERFNFVPQNPVDVLDADLKPSEINANASLKEIQEALNYDGEEEVYEQLEDDFFAKLIQGQFQEKHKKQQDRIIAKNATSTPNVERDALSKQKTNIIQTGFKKKGNNGVKVHQSGIELDQALQKAVHNYDHNIQDNDNQQDEDDDDEEDDEYMKTKRQNINYIDLEQRQQYIGRDGELDWRMLTKDEKKTYMKTKKIEQNYDVLRRRQIQQKMKGKVNIQASQLHLKQLIQHITYQDDHVMQKALEKDLSQKVNLDQSQDSLSSVQEDDIVSFHQKTSIIATNLSFVQQPNKPHKKRPEKVVQEEFINRTKPISTKIDPNQTPEERKERKKKLKQQKNQKKKQKKQFAQKFSKIRKETLKKQNVKNPLNKVSYIKIY